MGAQGDHMRIKWRSNGVQKLSHGGCYAQRRERERSEILYMYIIQRISRKNRHHGPAKNAGTKGHELAAKDTQTGTLSEYGAARGTSPYVPWVRAPSNDSKYMYVHTHPASVKGTP